MATPPARTELADTYPNPSNAVFRTGIGKLWDYVTERLGASGSAADARSALGIGSAITFRNLLINAGGWVNQRGAVSGAATGSANQYTLDRWRVVVSGQNLTFSAAAPDVTMTAPAGGLEQVIEGANVIGGVYTLSWTGTATATVNGAAITNGGNTASLSANTNVTIRFSSGTVLRPQFELGTVATPFERRLLGTEIQLCQRYFWMMLGGGVYAHGMAASSGVLITFQFPVVMRANPTLGYNLMACIKNDGTNTSVSSASIALGGAMTTMLSIVTAGGLTVGDATTLVGAGGTSNVSFTAEL